MQRTKGNKQKCESQPGLHEGDADYKLANTKQRITSDSSVPSEGPIDSRSMRVSHLSRCEVIDLVRNVLGR